MPSCGQGILSLSGHSLHRLLGSGTGQAEIARGVWGQSRLQGVAAVRWGPGLLLGCWGANQTVTPRGGYQGELTIPIGDAIGELTLW